MLKTKLDGRFVPDLILVYDFRSSSRPPLGIPPRIFSKTLFTKSVEPPAMRIPAVKNKNRDIN